MRRARWLPALLLIGLLSWACESKLSWEGRYAGQPGLGPAGSVTLVLQAGGKGQWTAEQESTPLRWEERSGALWLHLKTGGVIMVCRSTILTQPARMVADEEEKHSEHLDAILFIDRCCRISKSLNSESVYFPRIV